MSSLITRRRFVTSIVLSALAAPVLQACAGPSASPPVAPASQPAGSVAQTTAPASSTAPAGAKTALSIATYAGTIGDWERHFVEQWSGQHSDVKVTVDVIPYNDMAKKQLLQISAGDMEDISFSGIKWYPYTIFKGGFRTLDDYVKSKDPGLDDFFPSAIGNSKFEGKLYGLPYHFDPGNLAIAYFNLNLLGAKGITAPTDDWTYKDVPDLGAKLTDPSKNVWGVSYTPTTFYDFASLARTWGTDIFSSDAKKLLFDTDQKSIAAAQWLTDLHVKYHVAPNREESQGLSFAAGQVAINFAGNAFQSFAKQIGDKFKWTIAMFPKGPTGLRGYHSFNEMWSIYAKSKQPELAYELMTVLTSKEAFVYKSTEGINDPGTRKSAWADPAVVKMNPGIDRLLNWITSGEGPFPIPYNLRFSELQDKWQNVSLPVFYGEVPFEQGMKQVQDECQAIMDEPRG